MVEQLDMFIAPKVPSFLDGLDQGDPEGLRYYQRDAVDAFQQALDAGHRKVLLVEATGLGKTQIFSAVAKRWEGRVLVLAHREELVFQARDRLEQMTGELVGVEKADLFAGRERIVVASVQTITKKKRLDRFAALGGPPTLVIVDEAHHYIAPSYRRPLEYFKDATILGVTATPWRSDKKALGRMFETVAHEKNVLAGIDEGFLVPLTGCQVDIQDIDLSEVKTTAGDFNQRQLDDEVLKGIEGIVQKTLELYPDRKGILFFPGKASANLAAARFNALSPDSARVVTDATPPDERTSIMAAVKRGEVQWLCNVMVATEGFDWPEASLIGLGRPTKSLTVYTQMIGRGTRTTADVNTIPEEHQADERKRRIADSSKPDCVLLDFVGNCGKHNPVSAVDIFQGSYTDAEKKVAKKLERESPGAEASPEDWLAKARKELEAMARAVKAKVTADVKRFDVFTATGISEKVSLEYTTKNGFEPASAAQRQALERAGINTDNTLSKNAASKALGALAVRRQHGLCTPSQLQTLMRNGWTQRNVSFTHASQLITYLRSKNWKVDPSQLQAISKQLKERAKNE
jgi:superfamily II DNA or RNA helicase